MRLFYRLLKWVLFSVLMGLLPFFITVIDNRQFSPTGLFGSGELGLVSIVLTGSSMGRLVGVQWQSHVQKTAGILATFSGFVLVVLAAFWYSTVSGPKPPPPTATCTESYWIFAVMLLLGITAILLNPESE